MKHTAFIGLIFLLIIDYCYPDITAEELSTSSKKAVDVAGNLVSTAGNMAAKVVDRVQKDFHGMMGKIVAGK